MALDVLVQVMRLLMADTAFLVVCLLLLIPLQRFKPATFAVMKRNLFGYFSNPTGYVFICLFVLVGSAFAFWPDEFFNSNLATLGELNKSFPLVMLLFIPTITMSIWSEEKRQGTDELLLTIPATDWDIVLGKYLAAAAIYTASLVFSQIANFTVLNVLALGDIDTGLFVTTYLGYWLIGLAMLSLGMAASFLTHNLTIAFILGALFNAPLVATANVADFGSFFLKSIGGLTGPLSALFGEETASIVSQWSYGYQLQDFGRGVISLRAILFFASLIVIGLYLAIILIGRRHWYAGKDGQSMRWHYIVRGLALVVMAFALNLVLSRYDRVRWDTTSEKISSLSPDTKRLLENLDPQHTTLIEAFISKSVPEQYTRAKVDLITMLNEFGAIGGNKLQVKIYDNLDPFSEGAIRAEQQYGIEPETVTTQERGAYKQETIFLGAAFRSGLEKVVVPFFDQGIPVEYELIRSINTVTQPERPRVGIVRTDAQLLGGFVMQGGRPVQVQRQMIVDELEKQYEVVEVDPDSEFETCDVLMVVQPSSLTAPQLENLISAIRSGQPTAIFEDPLPYFLGAPGTGQPKPPSVVSGQTQASSKGDITRLWSMLGLEMIGDPSLVGGFDAHIIFQNHNPYPKSRNVLLTREFVFASTDAPGAVDALSVENTITSGLDQVLMPFPGAIREDKSKGMTFEKLVSTGNETGTIKYGEIAMAQRAAGSAFANELPNYRRPTGVRYCLAAQITGRVKAETALPGLPGTGNASGEAEVNVVFVADADLLSSQFLLIRARPQVADVDWQFDNVPFVLNVLDKLAGDDRLIEIRKRQTRHSTLRMIDAATETARDNHAKLSEEFEKNFNAEKSNAESTMQKAVNQLRATIEKRQQEGKTADVNRLVTELTMKQQVLQRRTETAIRKLEKERDRNRKVVEQELNQAVVGVQNAYKALAVLLPPIPPLIVGLIVFWKRRKRELEGVIDERLISIPMDSKKRARMSSGEPS